MKKPEISNDDEIRIANRIPPEEYESDWWLIVSRKVYQAGIDYCYREMLEQFINWIEVRMSNSWQGSTVNPTTSLTFHIKELQALQLEEWERSERKSNG